MSCGSKVVDCDIMQYERPPLKRVSDDTWPKQPGCLHSPLLKCISLDNVVCDELHLLLRIMDRLLAGIILNAIDRDQVGTLTGNTEWQFEALTFHVGN